MSTYRVGLSNVLSFFIALKMSDNTSLPSKFLIAKARNNIAPLSDNKDRFLMSFVSFVNDVEGASLEITLQVSGLLVSGKLIAESDYFRRFAEQVYGDLDDLKDDAELRDDLKKDFSHMVSWGTVHRESSKYSKLSYIHLENCAIISSNSIPSYTALWRGRISQIDGFFLGKPSASRKK